MLKVLIFAPLALEYGRGGEISAIELAAGLQRFYKITLVDTNRSFGERVLSKQVISKKLKGVRRSDQIKFAIIKLFDKNLDFPYPWEIVKLFKIVKNNDIIYTSVSNFKTDLLFMISSLLYRRAQFIVGYRKPLHSDKRFSLYNFKYRLSILFFSLFKKRIYHHTISLHAKKFLDNFYDPDKVFHIIHGIELENYVGNALKKKENNTLKFIYVGYLDDVHKGVGVLLNAIEQLIEKNRGLNILFEFCGIGPLESKLRKLEGKFPRQLKYNGYVSNNEISKYYKRCDVLLFPSRREPFGRVIIEALAANLLIICSKTFGSYEILSDKDFAFFFLEFSQEAIIEKICEIYDLWIDNPEKFKRLKISAKEYAFQNYSFSKELEMFKTLITEIRKNK